MDPLDDHQRAQDAFAAVLANVADDQVDGPTPCSGWAVRDLVGHVIAGNNRTAEVAPAEPADLATMDADQLRAAVATSARAAQDRFAAPDGLTRIIKLPFGELPGAAVVGMRASDVFTHAWDLAAATGQPTDVDPELAERLLGFARQRVQPSFRGAAGPFGEEQPCPEDRPAADRLAAFLGRTVS